MINITASAPASQAFGPQYTASNTVWQQEIFHQTESIPTQSVSEQVPGVSASQRPVSAGLGSSYVELDGR